MDIIACFKAKRAGEEYLKAKNREGQAQIILTLIFSVSQGLYKRRSQTRYGGRMIEVTIKIPENKFHRVAAVLQEHGVEIMKMRDAFDKDTYRKLEHIELKEIPDIVAIGGDALEDTETMRFASNKPLYC